MRFHAGPVYSLDDLLIFDTRAATEVASRSRVNYNTSNYLYLTHVFYRSIDVEPPRLGVQARDINHHMRIVLKQ